MCGHLKESGHADSWFLWPGDESWGLQQHCMVHNQQQAVTTGADLAAGGGAEARGGSRKRHREGEASEDGEETWSMANARRQMAVDRAKQRKLSAAELQYWKGWEARSREEACGQKKKGKKGKAQKQQAQQAQKKHANMVSVFRSRHKGANVAMLRPPQIDTPLRGGSSSSNGSSSRNDGDGGGAKSFESLSYSKDHGGGGGGGSSSSSSSSSSANNNSTEHPAKMRETVGGKFRISVRSQDEHPAKMRETVGGKFRISVRSQDGKQLSLAVRRTTLLKKVLVVACKKWGHIDPSFVRLLLDGGRLQPDGTVGANDIEHGDTIDLQLEKPYNPRPMLYAAGPSPAYSDCEEMPCTTAAAAASSAATTKKTAVINIMDFFPKARAKPGVTVKVRLEKGDAAEFTIPRDKCFMELWEAVRAKFSRSITRLEVTGGFAIALASGISDETPESLDLKDGDLVEAFDDEDDYEKQGLRPDWEWADYLEHDWLELHDACPGDDEFDGARSYVVECIYPTEDYGGRVVINKYGCREWRADRVGDTEAVQPPAPAALATPATSAVPEPGAGNAAWVGTATDEAEIRYALRCAEGPHGVVAEVGLGAFDTGEVRQTVPIAPGAYELSAPLNVNTPVVLCVSEAEGEVILRGRGHGVFAFGCQSTTPDECDHKHCGRVRLGVGVSVETEAYGLSSKDAPRTYEQTCPARICCLVEGEEDEDGDDEDEDVKAAIQRAWRLVSGKLSGWRGTVLRAEKKAWAADEGEWGGWGFIVHIKFQWTSWKEMRMETDDSEYTAMDRRTLGFADEPYPDALLALIRDGGGDEDFKVWGWHDATRNVDRWDNAHNAQRRGPGYETWVPLSAMQELLRQQEALLDKDHDEAEFSPHDLACIRKGCYFCRMCGRQGHDADWCEA
jgi:hypothetical protein